MAVTSLSNLDQKLLIQECELFIDNYRLIEKTFKWETYNTVSLASVVLAALQKKADSEKMKEANRLLKKKFSLFSTIRGNMRMILLVLMSLAEDAEGFIDKIEEIAAQFKKELKLEGREYQYVAAVMIHEYTDEKFRQEIISSTILYYNQLHQKHRFAVTAAFLPIIALAIINEVDIDEMFEEMVRGTEYLHGCFSEVYCRYLCCLLAVQPLPMEEKCERIWQLYNCLKQHDFKYGKDSKLMSLSMLLYTQLTNEEITAQIDFVDSILKQQKGFGDFLLGRKKRLMLDSFIVTNYNTADNDILTVSIMVPAIMVMLEEQAAAAAAAA